ncbi:MAG TPA: DNA repair protein RecO [Candidatus Paceibacterota bacterium]|nr:DNA repair protein RecO [Verrucomicrobiota bacterium]HRY51260.1 DNA repair protein RecO [Candidatus Paceibacterota bacterium]
MIEEATGLVLRVFPLTETSLIVRWLTRDQGRLATVARGARRPKSPLRGKLDLFFLADFSFRRNTRSNLHTLHEVQVQKAFACFRLDVSRLQQAAYVSALVESTTETDTPLPGALQLVIGFLELLEREGPSALWIHAFEIKWLRELGLLPELITLSSIPGTRQILEKLLDFDWERIGRLRASPQQREEINHRIEGILQSQGDALPRGRGNALAC